MTITKHDEIVDWMTNNPGGWTANEILAGAGIAGRSQMASRLLGDLVCLGKIYYSNDCRRGKYVRTYRLVSMHSDAAVVAILRCRPPKELPEGRQYECRHNKEPAASESLVWRRPDGGPC